MQSFIHIQELRQARMAFRGTLGLVPTMGALHEGHLTLVRRAKAECNHVGVSIFVNPSQFAANEDLSRYPRDLKRDLSLLEPLGVDLIWVPRPEDVYPQGYQTWINVSEIAKPLEGDRRPGHFQGVATVVAKLFHVFEPDRAYFGQKDAQQVAVIQRMVQDLNFPLQIVVCPIVRGPDGLALSSRNAYLRPPERHAALVLFRALAAARDAYDAGERDVNRLRAVMREVLGTEPLADVDYISAADPATLHELDRIESGVLLSLAVRIGKTRLIDNFLLDSGGHHAARD
jgi:pantoate--beta-alanine ligase